MRNSIVDVPLRMGTHTKGQLPPRSPYRHGMVVVCMITYMLWWSWCVLAFKNVVYTFHQSTVSLYCHVLSYKPLVSWKNWVLKIVVDHLVLSSTDCILGFCWKSIVVLNFSIWYRNMYFPITLNTRLHKYWLSHITEIFRYFENTLRPDCQPITADLQVTFHDVIVIYNTDSELFKTCHKSLNLQATTFCWLSVSVLLTFC